jgi:hypothetical protein
MVDNIMTELRNTDYLLEVSKGNVAGASVIHKFGRNSAVSTTIVPVCDGGAYQTPTSAASLELVSSSTNDVNTSGSGAHHVFVQGLDGSFAEQSETVNLNGTTAVALSNTYMRVFRMYVVAAGQYANQTVPSQDGVLTLRVASAGATWATIPDLATNFGGGQSLIGAYTVPAGKTAYLLSSAIAIDTNKTATLYFFQRTNADDVTTPFSGTFRVQNVYTGMTGFNEIIHKSNEAYPEKTDIGFMAEAASTSDVAVEFELLLVDN